jgi:uncharacterized protein (DUF2132 family)
MRFLYQATEQIKYYQKWILRAVTLLSEEKIELAHERLEGIYINMDKKVKMATSGIQFTLVWETYK